MFSLKDARDRRKFTLAGRSLVLFIFIYFILKRKKCLLLIIYTVLISMQVCSLKKIDILDSNATCRQVLTTFDMHNNFKMMDHYGTVTAHSKFRSIFFLEFSTSGIMNDIEQFLNIYLLITLPARALGNQVRLKTYLFLTFNTSM